MHSFSRSLMCDTSHVSDHAVCRKRDFSRLTRVAAVSDDPSLRSCRIHASLVLRMHSQCTGLLHTLCLIHFFNFIRVLRNIRHASVRAVTICLCGGIHDTPSFLDADEIVTIMTLIPPVVRKASPLEGWKTRQVSRALLSVREHSFAPFSVRLRSTGFCVGRRGSACPGAKRFLRRLGSSYMGAKAPFQATVV